MTFLRLMVGVTAMLGLFGGLELVRRRSLREELAALWGGIGLAVLVWTTWPEGLRAAARWIDTSPGVLGMGLGLAALGGLAFVLTLRLSRQTDQVRHLAQEIALLEARLTALEAERKQRGE